ncbi:MAG: hypothetical protein FWH21_07855 [Kiritimatiellaeota bacterium]|nr:hypothetical protein [Kiritimatiellota bacterium]
MIECKDYAKARRRAIGEHIQYNMHYRNRLPKDIIANSTVEQGKIGDFSIRWPADPKRIVFVRDCMVVVVSMNIDRDTERFAKALDESIRPRHHHH